MQVRHPTFEQFEQSFDKFLLQIDIKCNAESILKICENDIALAAWLQGRPVYSNGKEYIINPKDHIEVFILYLRSRKTKLINYLWEDNLPLSTAIKALKTESLKKFEDLIFEVLMSSICHSNNFITKFLEVMTTPQILENLLYQYKQKEKGTLPEASLIIAIENFLNRKKHSETLDDKFANNPSNIINNSDHRELTLTHEFNNAAQQRRPQPLPVIVESDDRVNKRKATGDLNSRPAKKYQGFLLFKDSEPSCPFGVEMEPIRWWIDESGQVYSNKR